MSDPVVLGLDLSLAGTACATRVRAWRHVTRGQRGDSHAERLARIRAVRDWTLAQLLAVRPDLLVLEGPAPNATARLSSWDRAKLWWDVMEAADSTGLAVAVAPPTSVKKYATGSGNCAKDEMIAAAYLRMPGLAVGNADEADAAWLMAAGYAWLESPLAPAVPQAQARAIAGIAWPARALVAAA